MIFKIKNKTYTLSFVVVLLFLALSSASLAEIKKTGLEEGSELTNNNAQEIEISTSKEVSNNINDHSSSNISEKETYKIYTHNELDYSFEYPENWLLSTYNSNGYRAVGLWDPIAQQQGDERGGHLYQGVKIEISACDCVPSMPIKEVLLERDSQTPETITSIEDLELSFYKEGNLTSVVKTEFQIEDSSIGKGIYFTNDKGLFFVITFGILNYGSLNQEQLEEYDLVFDKIIESFKFQ